MDEEIKKKLRDLQIECLYGRLYLFGNHQKTGDKCRFSFSHFDRTEAHRIANWLKDNGFKIGFWSSYYADPT